MKTAISLLALSLAIGLSINDSSAVEVSLNSLDVKTEAEDFIPRLLITTTGEGVDISLELTNLAAFSEAAALNSLTRFELKRRLEAGADLFQLTQAAECKLTKAQAYSMYLEQVQSKKRSGALDVHWSFVCVKPEALHQLKIQWFKHFPQGLDKLAIEWTSGATEGSLETNNDTVIRFE